MDRKEKLKTVLIVNRFGPDSKDITGKSAYDLGSFLANQGFSIKYLIVKSDGKNNSPTNKISANVKIIKVVSIKLGKRAFALLLSSLLEGFLLFLKAWFIKKEVAVVMTAPPLLNFFGILLKKVSQCKVVFWTMDLYPDAFVSNGTVSASNRLFKMVNNFVYRHPPHAIIALGEQQLAYIRQKYKQELPAFILPCGIRQIIMEKERPLNITDEDQCKLSFCYAGNIGQAHDEKFLIAFAKALEKDKHVLYINLYGTKARKVLAAIEHLPCIKKVGYLSYGQMHFIDIHLATLQAKWDHICVPSKAVSAICAGAVLLLNSSRACDAWNMFKEASWLIEQKEDDYKTNIDIFLKQINIEQIAVKKENALLLANRLVIQQNITFDLFAKWIGQNS